MVPKRIIGAQILSAKAAKQKGREENFMSSFKSTIEKIRALETERKNLLLEIEELKRMADAKSKALESEINMLRDEVKSLRLLLSGEEIDSDLRRKR
jgi:seryl-tRNA synthetase